MNTAFNKVVQHSEGMFDYMFRPGKVAFLLDGYAAGSAGKGKLESLIVKHTSFDNETKKLFVATTNSANASHWVYDDGKKMMFEVLPSSAYLHEKLSAVYICHGASFSVERLMEELKVSGLPKEKLRIHPKAGVIQKIDEDYEKGLCDVNGNYYPENEQTAGTIAGGSTCSGSGAVRAKKCVRNKTLVYAMDVPELKEFIVDTEKEIIERLSNGECGLLQIGQGFPLSYGLGYNKKNSTSRNVTIAAALDDALIPPFFAGNVILNGRTFPIKINNKKYKTVGGKVYEEYLDGEVIDKVYPEHLFKIERSDDRALIITRGGEFINSFEMEEFPNYPVEIVDSFSGTGYSKHWNEESKQEEITWEDVEAQYGKKIPLDVKCTSLTKLIRRVFKFDKDLLDDGIVYNMPPEGNHVFISINFVNWVDCEMEDKTDVVTDKAKQWIIENMGDVLAEYPNVGLAVLGTGRESDAFVAVDPFSPEELSE